MERFAKAFALGILSVFSVTAGNLFSDEGLSPDRIEAQKQALHVVLVAPDLKDSCATHSGVDVAFVRDTTLSLLKARAVNALPFATIDDAKKFSQTQRTYFHALSARLVVAVEVSCPTNPDSVTAMISVALMRYDVGRKEEVETWMMRTRLPEVAKDGVKARLKQALERRVADYQRADHNDETMTAALRAWNENLLSMKARSVRRPAKKSR